MRGRSSSLGDIGLLQRRYLRPGGDADGVEFAFEHRTDARNQLEVVRLAGRSYRTAWRRRRGSVTRWSSAAGARDCALVSDLARVDLAGSAIPRQWRSHASHGSARRRPWQPCWPPCAHSRRWRSRPGRRRRLERRCCFLGRDILAARGSRLRCRQREPARPRPAPGQQPERPAAAGTACRCAWRSAFRAASSAPPSAAPNWRTTCGPGFGIAPLAGARICRGFASKLSTRQVFVGIVALTITIGALTQAPRHSTSSQLSLPSPKSRTDRALMLVLADVADVACRRRAACTASCRTPDMGLACRPACSRNCV